jgi:hypothetical protein
MSQKPVATWIFDSGPLTFVPTVGGGATVNWQVRFSLANDIITLRAEVFNSSNGRTDNTITGNVVFSVNGSQVIFAPFTATGSWPLVYTYTISAYSIKNYSQVRPRLTNVSVSTQGTSRTTSLPAAYGTLYDVKQPSGPLPSIITCNTNTNTLPMILFLPTLPSGALTFIKTFGIHGISIANFSLDGVTDTYTLPSMAGMSIFTDSSGNNFVVSYYTPTNVLTDTTTGGTVATQSVVLANITSGNKLVGLPNPANSSYLMVCGYTTGTSTTNRLYIITNGYTYDANGASARYFTTAGGPSIGLLFVSDGSLWHMVGIYRGTNTTFDTTVGGYTQATSSIAMSSSITSDSMNVSATDPASNTAVLHIWKTKAIQWLNGAVVGANWNDAVNANYHRFYRNDNPDYSCYMVVNTKVGTGTPTVFPVAQYPADT